MVLVLLDLGSATLGLPQRARLIPQDVFFEGMRLGLFRFGLEYGTGVRTLIPSAAPYAAAAGLLAANLPWWQTLGAGAAFGLGRALASLQHVLAGAAVWQALGPRSRLLERAATVVTALGVGLLGWVLRG